MIRIVHFRHSPLVAMLPGLFSPSRRKVAARPRSAGRGRDPERDRVDDSIHDAMSRGDREALARTILDFASGLILARRQALPTGLDLDSVIQEATLSALAGLARWDPSRGVPARVWVWRAVETSLRTQCRSHVRWAKRHRPLQEAA